MTVSHTKARAHTDNGKSTQKRGLTLRGWSLNAGGEAKRADENNILLNQLLSVLSALLSIPPPHEFPPLSVIQHVLFLPALLARGTLALANRHLSQMAADPRGAPHHPPHTEPLCRAERLSTPPAAALGAQVDDDIISAGPRSCVGQENWLTLLALPSNIRSIDCPSFLFKAYSPNPVSTIPHGSLNRPFCCHTNNCVLISWVSVQSYWLHCAAHINIFPYNVHVDNVTLCMGCCSGSLWE